jgi:hypothetical protein
MKIHFVASEIIAFLRRSQKTLFPIKLYMRASLEYVYVGQRIFFQNPLTF